MTTPDTPLAADAHLRAALRYAPDANVSAPPHLSAQIIAAGYRAAAEPAPVAQRPRRFWQTPWALGGSGAFATLLLAGFLGLLWRGETPGPAHEAPALDTVPAPEPDTATVAPGRAVTPAAQAEAQAVLPARAKPGTGNAAAAASPIARAQVPTQAQVQTQAQGRADTLPRARVGKEDAMVKPSPPAPRPAPLPAAAAAAPAPAPAPAPVAMAAAPAPAVMPPPPAPAEVAGVPGTADAARDAPNQRLALANRADAAPQAIRAAPRPQAPWMDALAAGRAVQWRLDGVERPAPNSWLYAVAAQAQGRWSMGTPLAATDAASAGERHVQWQQGEVVLGRLWLNTERVLTCDAQARCQQAVLAPDVARALLKSMPR